MLQLKHVKCIAETFFNNMSLEDMRHYGKLNDDLRNRKIYNEVYRRKSREEALLQTQKLLDKRRQKRNLIRTTNRTIVTSESQPYETLATNDTHDTSGNDSSIIEASTGGEFNLSLDKFFERPILIHEASYTPNSDFDAVFEPFTLWTRDPTVRTKLSHYAYLRGNLKLRIVTSSSRFHFGSLLVSFQPYLDSNRTLLSLIDAMSDMPELVRPSFHNYLSQSPERSVLKFGKDNILEMTVPMLLPKKYARLYNRDGLVITNDVDFEEMAPLGSMFYSSLNQLRVANDDEQSPVYIQTYAWMEDIELGPSTATDINITAEAQPQSAFDSVRSAVNNNKVLNSISDSVKGYVSDEYSDAGPAAKIASAVSTAAEKLSDVPIIGVAARATSIASKAGARLLKMFGFSRPSQIEPAIFAKVVAVSNGAFLENKDTAFKLTADPKQELSVQPLGGEYNMDPMALKFMTSRESYFHTFNWSADDDPRLTTLALFPVSPLISTSFTTLDPQPRTVVQGSALSYAAIPFHNWRGTISFRFEVVASSFHRGKLLIIYEPNSAGLELINAAPTNLNQQYVFCLDIEEDRDVTIDCGFVHDRLFANTKAYNYDMLDSLVDLTYTTADIPIHNSMCEDNSCIGSLYIRPFTKLTSPSTNATGDVQINCYVYSDDMEFARPLSMSNVYTSNNVVTRKIGAIGTRVSEEITSESQPTALPDGGASQINVGPNVRTSSKRHLINRVKPKNDDVYLYHFGEKIESFRALLKRDEASGRITVPGVTPNTAALHIPLYPVARYEMIPRYNFPENVDTVIATGERVGLPTLFDHLRYAYLFCKGGYRTRLIFYNGNATHYNSKPVATVVRTQLTFPLYEAVSLNEPLGNSMEGSAYFDSTNGSGIEYELPYYSTDMFTIPQDILVHNLPNNINAEMFQDDQFSYQGAEVRMNTIAGTSSTCVINTSAAEDFTFFRFQGGSFYTKPA